MVSLVSLIEPRFAGLLRGERRYVWDSIIVEGADFVVAPTKGSIIAGWVMIIPKLHFLNFSKMAQVDTSIPFNFVQNVANRLGASQSVVWFEHGAPHLGSEVGCGVDHAHIHLLVDPPFNLTDFAEVAFKKSDSDWRKAPSTKVYDQLEGENQYYVFGDSTNAFISSGKSFGRQFFRKVVGELSGENDTWDYNVFSFEANVIATLSALTSRNEQAA